MNESMRFSRSDVIIFVFKFKQVRSRERLIKKKLTELLSLMINLVWIVLFLEKTVWIIFPPQNS